MSRLIKLKRGSTSENKAYTGQEGEVTVDLSTGNLHVHDGSLQGGYVVCPAAKSETVSSNNLTVVPNTFYNISGSISALTVNFTKSPLESSILFSCGSDSFSLTIQCKDSSGATVPWRMIDEEVSDLSFENGKSYLLAMLDGFIAISPVFSNS